MLIKMFVLHFLDLASNQVSNWSCQAKVFAYSNKKQFWLIATKFEKKKIRQQASLIQYFFKLSMFGIVWKLLCETSSFNGEKKMKFDFFLLSIKSFVATIKTGFNYF
jgi:hypothetical protein